MAAEPISGLAPAPPLERSAGLARIGFDVRDGATVLSDLYQSGSAKIRFPRCHDGDIFEAVVINTSGGMTDGDTFTVNARWQADAIATVTTQAAERIYKSRGADTSISTRLDVGAGATAFWLPQETILFDQCRLRRLTRVELAASARLLAVESLIYGRGAMGETVNHGVVRDRIELAIDGQVVWADAFAISGETGSGISAKLDRSAIGAGARASATVIARGPDPEVLLALVRNLADVSEVRHGVTTRETLVITRLLAENGAALRSALVVLLGALKVAMTGDAAPMSNLSALPRVWAI